MEIYWSETKHTTTASTITNLLHFSTFSPLLAIFFAHFFVFTFTSAAGAHFATLLLYSFSFFLCLVVRVATL